MESLSFKTYPGSWFVRMSRIAKLAPTSPQTRRFHLIECAPRATASRSSRTSSILMPACLFLIARWERTSMPTALLARIGCAYRAMQPQAFRISQTSTNACRSLSANRPMSNQPQPPRPPTERAPLVMAAPDIRIKRARRPVFQCQTASQAPTKTHQAHQHLIEFAYRAMA